MPISKDKCDGRETSVMFICEDRLYGVKGGKRGRCICEGIVCRGGKSEAEEIKSLPETLTVRGDGPA